MRLLRPALAILGPLALAVTPLAASPPSQDLVAVMIERPPARASLTGPSSDGAAAFDPLPAVVTALLGPHTVEYESFIVTLLPAQAADRLADTLEGRGLGFTTAQDRAIHLPHRSFDLADPATRIDEALAGLLEPTAVDNLWLVRFAYPVKPEWTAAFAGCGLETIGYLQQGTFLVRGSSVDTAKCGIDRFVSWVGPYLMTDRVSAEFLRREEIGSYWLQFVYGTDLDFKIAQLPEGMAAEERYESELGRMAYVQVETTAAALAELAATDEDLLSVTPYGVSEPSDERQGAIVAGFHDGRFVTSTGYLSWLAGRGLTSASNQQEVGVIDVGFDDGTTNNHPDLAGQVADISGPGSGGSSFNPEDDQGGHGTLVAGIIAGKGTGTGARDGSNFHLGLGIAPNAKLVVVKTEVSADDLARQELAVEFVRNSALSTRRGHIINQSWNERDQSSASYTPITSYSSKAQFFDIRTRDANNNTGFSGAQKTLFVYSAGNYRQTCNSLDFNTVASPAVAKNVIAVGATRSDRPYPLSSLEESTNEPPADCKNCTVNDPKIPDTENFGRPYEEPGGVDPLMNNINNHVSRVAHFSGRGTYFAPYPDSRRSYNRRIKPDVVAPAVRVYSTVPYDFDKYDKRTTVTGCTRYYPKPGHLQFAYHTYGSGTSFAAPVVSGVAALARKKLLDSGVDPSPSLLKAGIIATADDLGDIPNSGNASDHRPSPIYGWGRVNLARLTDSRARFYRNEVPSDALSTGQSRVWYRTIASGNVDTYIVLAWSDEPAAISTSGDNNNVLVNDLDLKVQGGVYRGNVFNESVLGAQDGYSYPHQVCSCARDTVNNVEAVFIPAGTYSSGTSVSLNVVGTNVPTGPQDFSIYAYNVQ